jgi:hypothetical protein
VVIGHLKPPGNRRLAEVVADFVAPYAGRTRPRTRVRDGDAASGDDGPDDLDLDGCPLVAREPVDVAVEVAGA